MYKRLGENVWACSSGDADIVWDRMLFVGGESSIEKRVEKGNVETKLKSRNESNASGG